MPVLNGSANKCVFKCDVKYSMDEGERMFKGSSFQS